ncbi:MAG: FHA domain-containing protein [Polyangia bacterium]
MCARCRKDNQAHYKFCLGCGAELGASPDEAPVGPRAPLATAPTMMAEAPRLPTEPPVFGDMGPAYESDPAATDPEIPSFAPAAIVSDDFAPAESAIAERACASCGTVVAGGYRFCPACGAPVGDSPAPARITNSPRAASAPAPEGRLVLLRPDGTEGGDHPLVVGENKIGRALGALFEADGYLSPVHAEMVLNAAGLVVRDLGSLNGVFVRITEEEELLGGDVVRIGQELLRFDAIPAPEPLDDGTEVLGSPNPGYWGRLAVVVGRDQDGSAFPLYGDAVILGREHGDITFPEDGYVSGTHARVSFRDGRYWLSDLNSSNGTFVRIRERVIPSGGQVLLGQQLFRVVYQ